MLTTNETNDKNQVRKDSMQSSPFNNWKGKETSGTAPQETDRRMSNQASDMQESECRELADYLFEFLQSPENSSASEPRNSKSEEGE